MNRRRSAPSRIVTSTYRYKPPPERKGRKLAEITGPAVIGKRVTLPAVAKSRIRHATFGQRRPQADTSS